MKTFASVTLAGAPSGESFQFQISMILFDSKFIPKLLCNSDFLFTIILCSLYVVEVYNVYTILSDVV
jgi:hypothetical protein